MTIRTIRLDPGSEAMLAEVVRRTGLNTSEALKAGLAALHERLRAADYPWEVYRSLELGPGGHARAPARRAKQAVREVIRGRARR